MPNESDINKGNLPDVINTGEVPLPINPIVLVDQRLAYLQSITGISTYNPRIVLRRIERDIKNRLALNLLTTERAGEDTTSSTSRVEAAEKIDLSLISVSAQLAFGTKYPTLSSEYNLEGNVDLACNVYLALFGNQTIIDELRRNDQFFRHPNTYHQDSFNDQWETQGLITDIPGVELYISERRDDKPTVWMHLRFGKPAQKTIALAEDTLAELDEENGNNQPYLT